MLIEFDADAIVSEGYDLTVPILICNSAEDYASVKGREGEQVDELERLITVRSSVRSARRRVSARRYLLQFRGQPSK